MNGDWLLQLANPGAASSDRAKWFYSLCMVIGLAILHTVGYPVCFQWQTAPRNTVLHAEGSCLESPLLFKLLGRFSISMASLIVLVARFSLLAIVFVFLKSILCPVDRHTALRMRSEFFVQLCFCVLFLR